MRTARALVIACVCLACGRGTSISSDGETYIEVPNVWSDGEPLRIDFFAGFDNPALRALSDPGPIERPKRICEQVDGTSGGSKLIKQEVEVCRSKGECKNLRVSGMSCKYGRLVEAYVTVDGTTHHFHNPIYD